MKYFRFFLRLVLFVTVFSSFSQINKTDISNLKRIVDEVKIVTNSPSISIVIVDRDNIILEYSTGLSDVGKGIKASSSTLYPIGSSSKAFTASLLGILDVELDRKPRDFVPNLSFSSSLTNQNITISDLLSHKSGLPRHDLSWYLFPSRDSDTLIKRIAYLKPFAQLRQEYKYNNFGYLIAGKIAERISGKNWSDLLKERIFDPLEMNDSYSKIDTNSIYLAKGYSNNGKASKLMHYYYLFAMNPAGGIISNTNNMGKWLQCWLGFGTIKDEVIIPVNYVHEAISSQTIMRSGLPDDLFPDLHFSNYGYGWMLSSYKGHYRVEHGGNINGFSANVCFFPSDDIGIAVLTNQNNSSAPYIVRNMIADLVLKEDKSDWISDYLEDQKEKGKLSKDNSVIEFVSPVNISRYKGVYKNKGYGKIKIQINSANRIVASFPSGDFVLIPKSENIFEMSSQGSTAVDPETVPNLIFNFSYDDSGEIKY